MDRLRIFVQDHLTSFRTILLGFFLLILAGAAVLALPVSSASHVPTPFLDALFTSASAVCVTGLIVFDTAIHWSQFGKLVILILIQIGGLGVVTAAAVTWMVTGKKIGILQRLTMQDSMSAPKIGGIVRFTLFVLKITFLIELAGAAALAPVFISDFGPYRGIFYAVFHSVSAFCNAGFDLMGVRSPFSSLTGYSDHTWVNGVIMALIIFGGIGFLTWEDLLANRFRFRRLKLQTKIILTSTGLLIAVPFLYFLFFEFENFPLHQRILYALFQAVTPRTAGFNTFDYGKMSEGGLLMTVILMLTGGAPGSTAGGLKITTLSVLVIAGRSYLLRREDVNCFHRRLEPSTVQNAFALLMVYLGLLIGGTMLISHIESLPVIRTMFECASALGTVGLSTGITPGLSAASKIILILFMYFGRTGGLTLAYAAVDAKRYLRARYPIEGVTVG